LIKSGDWLGISHTGGMSPWSRKYHCRIFLGRKRRICDLTKLPCRAERGIAVGLLCMSFILSRGGFCPIRKGVISVRTERRTSGKAFPRRGVGTRETGHFF